VRRVRGEGFNLYLMEDEYEFFTDLRKFHKISVSALIAYAIKKYLNDKIMDGGIDNYPFKNYILSCGIKDDYVYWQIIWGYPEKVGEFIPKLE